ncbi:MAG: response regulator [Crocinitomicaceae bacterium]
MRLKNIVLIDSDIFFARAFIEKVNQLGDFQVHHFLTFKEAYVNVADIYPELILTEHELSDCAGVNIISELLRRSPLSKLIMLSKQTDVAVIDEAYKKGAAKYFRKDVLLMDQIAGIISGFFPSDYPVNKKIVAAL